MRQPETASPPHYKGIENPFKKALCPDTGCCFKCAGTCLDHPTEKHLSGDNCVGLRRPHIFLRAMSSNYLTGEERLYKNILDSLKDGVITLDKRRRIIAFNPAMESIVGVSEGQVMHKSLASALPEMGFIREKINQVFRAGETFSDSNARLLKRNGQELPVSLVISPVTDDEGNSRGAVIMVRDRSYVEDLQRADRYVELVNAFRFISNSIVHEIKNPMGGMKGAAQLLQEELDDDQLREYVRVIINEVDRVTGLLDDLSNLYQLAELQLEKVNIHQVLDDVIMLETSKARGKGINILMDYDPSIPEIPADRHKLMQLFINIARNGIEAMPDGGVLTFSTKVSDQYRVTRSRGHQIASRMLMVTVEDTGEGISREDEDKIFTPYFTTKEEGTGLGLSVCMNIVEQHGGRMKINSRPGAGTEVAVLLPLGAV